MMPADYKKGVEARENIVALKEQLLKDKWADAFLRKLPKDEQIAWVKLQLSGSMNDEESVMLVGVLEKIIPDSVEFRRVLRDDIWMNSGVVGNPDVSFFLIGKVLSGWSWRWEDYDDSTFIYKGHELYESEDAKECLEFFCREYEKSYTDKKVLDSLMHDHINSHQDSSPWAPWLWRAEDLSFWVNFVQCHNGDKAELDGILLILLTTKVRIARNQRLHRWCRRSGLQSAMDASNISYALDPVARSEGAITLVIEYAEQIKRIEELAQRFIWQVIDGIDTEGLQNRERFPLGELYEAQGEVFIESTSVIWVIIWSSKEDMIGEKVNELVVALQDARAISLSDTEDPPQILIHIRDSSGETIFKEEREKQEV